MAASLLSLPAELRNEIYKHLLVGREPINPWSRENVPSSNLLFTNTTILHEASSLLYGNNCFDLTADPELQIRFLNTIGSVNASYLQYILIGFPEFHKLEDEVSLKEASRQALETTQSYCINLKSLTTMALTTYDMEIGLDSLDSPAICGRALALVDAHFRAIKSLQKIVIEVFEEEPNSDIRKKMQSHGWILKVVERVEEEFEGFTAEDCYEIVEDLDDDDDDGYEVDNDSDFWRRAAD